MVGEQLIPRRRARCCSDEVRCEACGLYALCRTAGLENPDSDLLDRIVARHQPVAKHEILFGAGDAFATVYAVKSGAFKTSITPDDGREQIIEFHFAGELLGLDGIAWGRYPYTARALEPGSVCAMSFDHLDLLGARFTEFQSHLIHQLGGRLAQDQWASTLARRYSAEERLAGFLLSVSERLGAHGFSADEFRLPMSRDDIASYLGLATETVCRLFRRFQAEGMVIARGKYTRLCDLDALRGLFPVQAPGGGAVIEVAAAPGVHALSAAGGGRVP